MAIRVLLSRVLGEKRMTQADLSRAVDVRPTTIGELYHELSERIKFDHLDKICKALDCEVSDILVRVDDDEVPNKESKGKKGKPSK